MRGAPTASHAPPAEPQEGGASPRRKTLSHVCSTTGIVLLVAAVLVPSEWRPALLLFAGLGFLALAHVLTPCVERLEQLRRARADLRQL